jgi:hypothetical protein
MWYQKIVEAGALDELAGGMDTSKSPEDILWEIRHNYSISKLPNFEHLYKYLLDLIDNKYTSDYLTSVITHLIYMYSKDAETVHRANRLVPLMIKNNKISQNEEMMLLPDTFSHMGSTLETHNTVYNFGYNKLLAYTKEGIDLPKRVRIYIMMNMDTLSSSSMQQSEARTEIKKYITDKDPMYEFLNADKYSGEQILKNIIDNIQSDAGRQLYYDVVQYSGLPIDDYLYLLDEAHNERVMDDLPKVYDLLINDQKFDKYIEYLDKNKNKFSPEHFENRFVGAFKYGMTYFMGDFWYEIFKNNRQIINEKIYPSCEYYYKPYLHRLGVGPKEEIIKEYIKASLENKDLANRKFKEIPTKEEIDAYVQKNSEKLNSYQSQRAQNTQTQNTTPQSANSPILDIFQKNLQNGYIEKHDITGEYEKLLNDILNSFGFNSDDQNIISDIKSRLKIYVFKNSEFYKDLLNTSLQEYGFITPTLMNSCGYFVPRFSDNNNGPSIFINEFISEDYVNSDNIINNLGITKDMINMSTAAHELAHLADYVIKGGSEVFSNVDPKTSLKEGEAYNQSRLYLSDIREIVARVYGNTSYMIEILHKRIEEMRTSEIIRKAVVEELSDMLMSNEASWLNATPMVSEQKLQEWAEKRFGPYENSEQPYTQATEDYLKQKQLAIKFYEEAGKVNREDIKKATIEEIQSLEDQAEILKTRVSEDSEEYKKLQEDIKKLKLKIRNIEAGAFDHDIYTIVKSVASYIAFKDIKITNEIAADPNYVSPISIRKDQMAANTTGDTTPLSNQELKTMRDFDLGQVAQGTEGGKTLKEPKPSFMSYDIYNPKWREEYPDTFK